MSRHRPAGSYGHSVRRIGPDHYRIWWTVDRYYAGSRLRHPRTSWRDTDLTGAKRFARKWELAAPEEMPDD